MFYYKYMEEIYMSVKSDINEMKKIYSNNRLIPFIGAGMSRPFNIPNWKELLITLCEKLIDEEDINKMIRKDIDSGKYWNAVDDIMFYSIKDEEYVQNQVVDIINETILLDKSKDSNYVDLAKLEVPYYLTTNYDNLLGMNIKSNYQSTILSDINSGIQKLASDNEGKRIFHLHGDIANSKSIVLSKKKYNEVYSSDKYKTFFNFFRSGYTFLFIGFSFSDEYIINLMDTYKEYFNDYHYILLANPTREIQLEYMKKYKLIVIPYLVEDITDNTQHITAIRNVLQELYKDAENVDKENF